MSEITPPSQKLTPMFEQFFQIKENYQDALLFYRMGDFYELFYADAETAARELQIALTSRSSPNAEMRIPMCGVPYHAVDNYIPILLEKGYKVAICEQVEDPRQAKGLVKREVKRVLTQGTVVDDVNLVAKGHNFLAAMYWNETKSNGGLAWIDYSTGDWSGLYTKKKNELWQWAQKMSPKELLLPDGLTPPDFFALTDTRVNTMPERVYFAPNTAQKIILETCSIAELGAAGLEDKPELVRACGALLVYLQDTQKQKLKHVTPFKILNLGKHLILDEVTERNLEIFKTLDGRRGLGTLWNVLDNTETPMGGRLLEERLRHPWRELGPIKETQEAVSYFFTNDTLRKHTRTALDEVYDLERLTTRISLSRAAPKDFVALGQSLSALPRIRAVLETPQVEGYPTGDQISGLELPSFLTSLLDRWDDLADYAKKLHDAIVDAPPNVITEGSLFKTGYNSELDELIDLNEHGQARVEALCAREAESTGISKLKLKYNRVFGYFFDVPKTALDKVPEHFIRRQTLANSERYTTEELKELETKLMDAADKRKSLEYKLFQELREEIAQIRPRVLFMSDVIAALDYWQSLAETARKWNWCKPELHNKQDITIKNGRHPVVEAVQGGSNFVPNDLHMDENRRMLLITGPNMAGKSTVLRQAAIICLLAQIGSFVPAQQAQLGIADRIFSRVGASDNLAQGQSTFMVEMMETARILRQASKRSLIILDEIGRGTSTFDGLSLAWAVVEDLAKRSGGIRTLFATHYHELTVLEGKIPGVHNMNIAIKEWQGDIVFLRRLVPGPSDRSYGIEVARLAGVPQSVVRRAKIILTELEKNARDSKKMQMQQESQSLLPGMPPPSIPEPEPEPEINQPDHPLLVTLRDLDTNAITPMHALTLLTEWKMLWGETPEGE